MFNPPNDLTGTVAFVSGASRGLGRTYALALAKAGAKVFATARTAQGDPATQGSLAELEATGRAEGLDIAIGRMNLANTCDIEAAVTTCVERFGRLDTVVNNAVWTINRLDLLEIDVEEWEMAFRINVIAPYQLMRAAAAHMQKNGGGSVINLTSIAARSIESAVTSAGFPTYSVTKSALERLSSYAGADLAQSGIAVNAISPGNAEYYMRDGRDPDMEFWGAPMVHLAAQRAPGGITGKIVHTYEYGDKWGPLYDTLPTRDARLNKMLAVSDNPEGYFAQR